jgi:hypothetical protein
LRTERAADQNSDKLLRLLMPLVKPPVRLNRLGNICPFWGEKEEVRQTPSVSDESVDVKRCQWSGGPSVKMETIDRIA